ncbi:hypothetical protein RB195_026530 [Necator americanus]|uniref:Reverse transcriptase domain-containing protein n=1 Tax=Necator americanus TaxID=51031 RepID=A0ABR1EWT4_NECAM
MAVKVDTGEVELRVVSAYAPQMGCSEEEKACFWEDLERYVQSLEDEEVLLFGGDFNGHVGSRKDGFESCHGGYGYGARNDDESWNHVAAQHHLPVMDLKISRPRTRHPRTETQRMKWWNLKDRKKVFEVFERVLEARLRKIVSVLLNQCGFVKDCSTIDAIHAVRILLEKDREKNRSVHLAFLDLVEAFDRVPAELLWMSMRSHRVPEEYVRWIKLLHAKPTSVVRCAAGTSRPFPIQVGAHQGSPLSPLLFILCMDTITKEIQKQHPWALLFADDVMFASESRDDLQKQVLEGSAAAIWIAPQHIKN